MSCPRCGREHGGNFGPVCKTAPRTLEPFADGDAALERGLSKAYAAGFKAGRLEAAEMVRELGLSHSGALAVTLNALARQIKGDT